MRRAFLSGVAALALLAASLFGAYAEIKSPRNAPPQPPFFNGTALQFFPLYQNAAVIATAVAPTQNTARCAPFYEPNAFHADNAAMVVTTLGTGPLNFAIYTDAIDATSHKHQPQTLVTNPNVTFTVTSAVTAFASLGTAGVGIPIAQGLNWVCVNDTTATDAVRFNTMSGVVSLITGLVGTTTAGSTLSGNMIASYTIAETAGTTTTNWPSLVGATLTETNTTGIPALALRVATVP